MRIRPADKGDLTELHRLERAAFGSHAYPAFFLRQAWDLWPSSLLVAIETSAIVGYVLAGRGDADEGWILSLAVAPQARRMGLGRRLTEAAIDVLASQGCRRVRLTVEPASAAQALYVSLGFVEVEREPDYFGPGQARVVMSRG
ncbi:MAG: GNAT family N-acetyltransferase [Deltaproteobacteria bacterium]|nr:GNAT family N-acetyltransferase [Deltaproteobacteria bacterium]